VARETEQGLLIVGGLPYDAVYISDGPRGGNPEDRLIRSAVFEHPEPGIRRIGPDAS
jgi:hypothetical protein